MSYYNPDAATEVVVDASPFGLGAVLIQRDDKGTQHTVAYASRALTDVESATHKPNVKLLQSYGRVKTSTCICLDIISQ